MTTHRPLTIYGWGTIWIILYVAAVMLPLGLTLLGTLPEPRGWAVEFGVLLGFLAMTVMGMQFLLTARFKGIGYPYGVDTILQFHRQIGIVVLLILVAHPAVLILADRKYLEFFDPSVNFLRTVALVTALIATTLLVVLPLWRISFRLNYEWWRITHGLLGGLVIFIGLTHMIQVGHYVFGFWKQILWVAVAAGILGMLLHVRVLKPLKMRRRPWRVVEVRPERSEAVSLVVEPEGHDGMPFRGGQYAWITLRDSPFSLQQHPFSISSSGRRPKRIEFTIKALGDFTDSLPDVEPGTRAYLEGPYGTFCLAPQSEGGVFIMGGIGITPTMSILRTLRDENDGRPHLLIYGSTDWEDVVFREEIDDLQQALNLRVIHVLEEPHEGWTGEEGFIDADVLKRHVADLKGRNFEYFICGPEPMMDLVERSLLEMGVPLWKIRSERFKIV